MMVSDTVFMGSIGDVPDEPTSLSSTTGEPSAQIVDLRDDMDELTETVHNQWIQFCNDNEDIEVRLTAKCKKLLIFCIINICVSGGLACVILAMLLN